MVTKVTFCYFMVVVTVKLSSSDARGPIWAVVDKGDGDEEGPATVEVGAGMGC